MIKSIFRNYTLFKLIVSLFLLSIFYGFVLSVISQENYVLSWGFADRYAEFIQVNHQLHSSGLFSTLATTVDSVWHSDYNFLTALILSPFGLIFGTSRSTYILIILSVLYVPSFFLFLKLVDAFNSKNTFLQYLNLNFIFLFSSIIITPIIRNQPSIIGLIPITLIFLIYRRHQPLAIGLLLVILPLFNRWYFYFSFNFLLYYTIFNFQRHRLQSLLTIFFSIIFFLILSGPLWQNFFLVDYHQTYAFFRFSGNFFESILSTFNQLGLIFVFIFFIVNLLQKNYFLILLFCSIVAEFLFIQDFNIQHYYLLIIPILSSFATLILKNKNRIFQLLLFIIIIANFHFQPLIDKSGTKTFLQIASDLQQLPETAKIYIVSHSRPINASAFQNYSCYFEPSSLCSKILPVSYILARDGYPSSFSTANYFLVLKPEINTDPVIKELHSQITNNPNLYQPTKKYPLSETSEVWLYRKVNP